MKTRVQAEDKRWSESQNTDKANRVKPAQNLYNTRYWQDFTMSK